MSCKYMYLFSRCLLSYLSVNEVIEVGGETLVGQVGILSKNISSQVKILEGRGGGRMLHYCQLVKKDR